MKKCPKCGGIKFSVIAHVTQDWEVDENGTFSKCFNECVEVTHYPNDEDTFTCYECGYEAAGSKFNVMKPRAFIDMDGTLAEWKSAAIGALYEKGYFAALKPNEPVVSAVRELLRRAGDAYEVYICSCYFPNSKYALSEKEKWASAYLPELPESHMLFVPVGQTKASHIPRGVQPTDVLLDDYSKNLHEWKNAGGIGIKLLNGVNGNFGTWKGKRVGLDKDSIINAILQEFSLQEK